MRILTSLLFLIVLVFSCTSKKTVSETSTVSQVNEEQLIKEGFVKGIIKDFSNEDGNKKTMVFLDRNCYLDCFNG